MEIHRILWPTDFSENAKAALPMVTALAEKFGAEIHILYVMKEYLAFGARYGENDPEEAQKMEQMEKELVEKRLDKLCETFLNACPLYFRHTRVGEPEKEILKFIKENEIDLIVMANRGSESHFDFGRVADHVVKCTTVPILTVPA